MTQKRFRPACAPTGDGGGYMWYLYNQSLWKVVEVEMYILYLVLVLASSFFS